MLDVWLGSNAPRTPLCNDLLGMPLPLANGTSHELTGGRLVGVLEVPPLAANLGENEP